MAHYYATPRDEFDMVRGMRLFNWKTTHLAISWPKSLQDTFQESLNIKRPPEKTENDSNPLVEIVHGDSEGEG